MRLQWKKTFSKTSELDDFLLVEEWKAKVTYTFSNSEFKKLTSQIICLVDDNNAVSDQISVGNKVGVMVQQTPFYSESGGQLGDRGMLQTEVFDLFTYVFEKWMDCQNIIYTFCICLVKILFKADGFLFWILKNSNNKNVLKLFSCILMLKR